MIADRKNKILSPEQIKRTEIAAQRSDPDYRLACVELVCQVLQSTDKGIRRVCDAIRKDNPDFPPKSSIIDWMRQSDELAELYARAKAAQADHIFDDILEIADAQDDDEIITEDGKRLCNNEFVQRSKLRVDARKWVVAKLAPRKYGDKLEVEHSGSVTISPVDLDKYFG
jgi:hypothetical protein